MRLPCNEIQHIPRKAPTSYANLSLLRREQGYTPVRFHAKQAFILIGQCNSIPAGSIFGTIKIEPKQKIMDNLKDTERQELQSQIMAKRQQIDFEKASIATETAFSPDNQENPDVSEETKNFYDPAGNVIEKGELKELSDAEEDLIRLIDKLNKLDKED